MKLQVASLTILIGAGCAAPEEPVPASLELGTGTWRFEELDDGASVPLVHGAQGGWHFWVAVRARGVSADQGSLEIEVQRADE
ncbi:MAG: hypothetical protein IT378_10635, partial [Sandaracinaceae bacterium]|nr:hypothetical protein [Sandaracinaceae bacterium]